MIRNIGIFLLLILAINTSLFSQYHKVTLEEVSRDEPVRIRVKTSSGATFQGDVYELDDKFLTIIDKDGLVITILTDAITEIWEIESLTDKKGYFHDSAANRLLVIPTGFPMEKGEFHIADQEISAVTMSYGVSEHISV